MYTYSIGGNSIEDLTTKCNQVKEILLEALERDGLLTKPAAEIAREYAVVLYQPGWLGKLFRKVIGEKEGFVCIQIVKVV